MAALSIKSCSLVPLEACQQLFYFSSDKFLFSRLWYSLSAIMPVLSFNNRFKDAICQWFSTALLLLAGSFWIRKVLLFTNQLEIERDCIFSLNSSVNLLHLLVNLFSQNLWITSNSGAFQFGIFLSCFVTSSSVISTFSWMLTFSSSNSTSFNYSESSLYGTGLYYNLL